VSDPERLLDLTGQGEAPDFGLVLHASRLGSPADRDRAAEVLIDTAVGTYLLSFRSQGDKASAP
jgi:hypothetical protein